MRIAKFFACALAASTASFAFADAANVLVSFSTKADYYADGTPVLDGEWYALCWSSDGKFEGIDANCDPIGEGDLVCLMAPRAKNGCCPYTVFQVDSQSSNCKRTGVYTVILLDTRCGADGKPSKTIPTAFATVTAKDYTAGSATSGVTEKETEGGKWQYAGPDVGEIPNPVIKSFQILGDAKVQIDVEKLVPEVRYTVKMGESLDKIDTYHNALKSGSYEATFIIDKEDAKFFQVVREPLTNEPLTK